MSAVPNPAPAGLIVSVRALVRDYQQGTITVHALRGVDLDIAPGEFTALMGPSGSGKTTLLNCVGGLDEPTSGSVVVDGQELARMDRGALAARLAERCRQI